MRNLVIAVLTLAGLVNATPAAAQTAYSDAHARIQSIVERAVEQVELPDHSLHPTARYTYTARASTTCATNLNRYTPAYTHAGTTHAADMRPDSIRWDDIASIRTAGPVVTLTYALPQGYVWRFTAASRAEAQQFEAVGNQLIRACGTPVLQPYHSGFVDNGGGNYRCSFRNPRELTLSVFRNGSAIATYEIVRSFMNGDVILTVTLVREHDGSERLADMKVEYRSSTPMGAPLATASINIDGRLYSGFQSGIGSTTLQNGRTVYTATAWFDRGGFGLLDALERGHFITVQTYFQQDPSQLFTEMKPFNIGLSDIRPYLRRSDWKCIDPTPSDYSYSPQFLGPWLNAQPLPQGWSVRSVGRKDEVDVFEYTADLRANPASAASEGAAYLSRDACKYAQVRAQLAAGARMRADTIYMDANGKRTVTGPELRCL